MQQQQQSNSNKKIKNTKFQGNFSISLKQKTQDTQAEIIKNFGKNQQKFKF